jgi:serine/threonine protein kinase/Tol biopolymer transport system component
MPDIPQDRARFGDFELDVRAGELHVHGRKERLRNQTLQVLLVLIEHAGEIVLREEIEKRLWDSAVFVDKSTGVNNNIRRLRDLLSDSFETPKYIETVGGRGYRFLCPVEWLPSTTPAEVPARPKVQVANLSGMTVTHYRVGGIIGRGGMGIVYRAEDIRLGRAVALKFLPEEVGEDTKARERFEREARAVSALSHANICYVHEFDEYEDHPFIAMELLHGKTLRENLAEGRFRLTGPEGLEIAIQVASGLEAAHEKGIIHRDIKPANIFVTEKNVAKILDFGVAKVLQGSSSDPNSSDKTETASLSSEITGGGRQEGVRVDSDNEAEEFVAPEQGTQLQVPRPDRQGEASPLAITSGSAAAAPAKAGPTLTKTGMKLGTAGYMSPEQVRGESLDARTDIFSFGMVLYEMATGSRAFVAETEAVIHEVIVTRNPKPASEINPDVTPQMQAVIDRCLEKNPARRFQSAAEIRTALETLRPEERKAGLTAKKLFLGVAVAVVVAVLAFAVWWRNRPMASYVFDKFSMAPLTETGNVSLADISPDGKYLAYTDDESGKQSLWLHQIATASTVRLLGPVSGLRPGLRFTPDGNYIYFSQSDPDGNGPGLYRIPTVGGAPEKLRPDVFHDIFYQVGFSPDGRQLVFARRGRARNSLVIANIDGTNERTLLTFSPTEVVAMPAWSPSGNQIAFVIDEKAMGAFNCLAVVSTSGGRERRILHNIYSLFGAAWLPDESGLAISAPSAQTLPAVWIVSYPKGTLRRVTNDLAEYFGVSSALRGSRIVSVHRLLDSSLWVAPAANPSQAEHLRELSGRKDGMMGVTWLPDDSIVYASWEGETKDELWTVSGDGHDRRRLSNGPDADMHPAAASAAAKIVFARVDSISNKWDIWETNADGSEAKRLTSGSAIKLGPDISPDATWITYATTDGPYKMVLATGEISKLAPSGEYPAISPDGKWIAFVASEDQTNKNVIEIIPSEGHASPHLLPFVQEPQTPITANAGSPPIHWTADGRAITYVRTKDGVSNIWAQPLDGSPARQLTNFTSMYIWRHAWSPDGKYLVMARGNFSRDAVMLTDAR